MSLLDNLPHTATATRRRRTSGALGGTKDTRPTTLFTDRRCWQQPATASEVREFDARGIRVTDKIFFTDNPQDVGLSEKDFLQVTNLDTGRDDGYEVSHFSDPDASAGLGWLYKVMVVKTTTGSTDVAD